MNNSGEMVSMACQAASLPREVASSNPMTFSKSALRPDFLGDIDESRLIGCFRDDFSDGDKLALQSFIVQRFGLEQIEVLRDETDARRCAERHERDHTRIDLLSFDVAVLRQCGAALVARLSKLLSPKGILWVGTDDVSDRIEADLLPAGVFESAMSAPGPRVFAQIEGERSPRSVRYQIDLFRRKRYVERRHRARLNAAPNIPEVAVFVLTYKHEAFIAECLRSIMKQRGQFTMRVLIIDDVSPDATARIARSVIAENRNDRMTFELRVNPRNVGASANWGPALDWARGADYMTPCDGDDFWSSEYRIQEHIDFLREHPHALMSFNSFEFCTEDSSARRRGIHLDEEIISASRFVRDNPVGHLGSTFYCGELVDVFPLEPFFYVNGDWMINVYCSQIGQIGYLDEELSVYRLHGGGVWSLKKGVDRIIPTIDGVSKYNAFMDFHYNSDYNWLIGDRYGALAPFACGSSCDSVKVDLIVVYGGFPDESDFRYLELTSVLREIPSSLILSALDTAYQCRYPDLGSRIIDDHGTFPLCLGKMIYMTRLRDVLDNLGRIQDFGVPFVFSLCEGEELALGNPHADRQLAGVLASSCFQKVIVSHRRLHDYIVQRGFCSAEKIEIIQGGILPKVPAEGAFPKLRWGQGKASLDICVVAREPVSSNGIGRQNIFARIIEILGQRHDNIVFHVVGVAGPYKVGIDCIDGRVKFHGSLRPSQFDLFFQGIDIILSPSLIHEVGLGESGIVVENLCIEAGARGVAIFADDEFIGANSRFIDGKTIVVAKSEARDIADEIERYYADPDALRALGERTAQFVREFYSVESQVVPRIDFLRRAIGNSAPVGDVLALRVRIAMMQSELARLDRRQRRKAKASKLRRGLRRLLAGRSDTTARQFWEIFRAAGFKGVRRALRAIGS